MARLFSENSPSSNRNWKRTFQGLFQIANKPNHSAMTQEAIDPTTAITNAATSVGITLQPERLERLVEIANTATYRRN